MLKYLRIVILHIYIIWIQAPKNSDKLTTSPSPILLFVQPHPLNLSVQPPLMIRSGSGKFALI